ALLATPAGRAAEVTRIRAAAEKNLADELKEAAGNRAESLKDADEKPAKVEAAYARHVKGAQDRHARALARADRLEKGLPDAEPAITVTTGSKRKDGWFNPGIKKAVANPDYYWT